MGGEQDEEQISRMLEIRGLGLHHISHLRN